VLNVADSGDLSAGRINDCCKQSGKNNNEHKDKRLSIMDLAGLAHI
jgi:hypothetical protein